MLHSLHTVKAPIYTREDEPSLNGRRCKERSPSKIQKRINMHEIKTEGKDKKNLLLICYLELPFCYFCCLLFLNSQKKKNFIKNINKICYLLIHFHFKCEIVVSFFLPFLLFPHFRQNYSLLQVYYLSGEDLFFQE